MFWTPSSPLLARGRPSSECGSGSPREDRVNGFEKEARDLKLPTDRVRTSRPAGTLRLAARSGPRGP